MSKVNIVQIVNQSGDNPTLFLDDKGRVWYQEAKTYGKYPAIPETVLSWVKVDLPDEPTPEAA